VELSERTLTALGFDQIRSAVAGRCRTEMGKARALARGFLTGADEVLASFRLVPGLVSAPPLVYGWHGGDA